MFPITSLFFRSAPVHQPLSESWEDVEILFCLLGTLQQFSNKFAEINKARDNKLSRSSIHILYTNKEMKSS